MNSLEMGNFYINHDNQKKNRSLHRINVSKRICCCKEVKEIKTVLNSFQNTEFVSVSKLEQCVYFINTDNNVSQLIIALNEKG